MESEGVFFNRERLYTLVKTIQLSMSVIVILSRRKVGNGGLLGLHPVFTVDIIET
jgi:hypothetical protein